MVVLYSDNVSEECYLQDDVKPKWLCSIVCAKGAMASIGRKSQHELLGQPL